MKNDCPSGHYDKKLSRHPRDKPIYQKARISIIVFLRKNPNFWTHLHNIYIYTSPKAQICVYSYSLMGTRLYSLKTPGSIIQLSLYFYTSLSPLFNNPMGKKTKSKARLDKFYRFAKEQGYRSRASFKLIQLNNKYNFLSSCRALVDLCAAPGGWLQVAEKFMPIGTIKIGIDLDPIKRIPGVKTFQEDITTQKCIDLLKKQLVGEKADVFLNDGAPNVGANWSKDAHNQSELVLSALKLTTMFLREGGYFVTKVFRSTDFNSLIWVFNKFFKKVQITKPQASRFSSAQIFVVCIGYLAPTFIDEKLFDPKEVFKTTERDHAESQLQKEITSLDKLMEKRRHRGGYADDAPMHLYREITLTNFLEADNPFPIFMEYNKMIVSEEQKQKYFGLAKMPEDFMQLIEDLKVLGKRDVSILLKWRGKIKQALYKEAHQSKKEKKAKQVDSEEQLERELLEKHRKEHKELRKQKEKEDQQILMSKGIIEGQVHDDNLSESFGDILDEHDIQQLGYESVSEEEKGPVKPQKKLSYQTPQELNEDLENMYEARKAKLAEKTKQIQKVRADKKGKAKEREIDDDKFKARRIEEEEPNLRALARDRILDGQILEEDTKLKFRNPLSTKIDDDDIYLSEEESADKYQGVEVDPNEKVPGELEDDDAYKIHKPLTDMQKRRRQLKKKAKKEQKSTANEQKENEIEVVPAPKTIDDYDIQGLAETLAIAKKMLRGRTRQEIINGTYSRYNYEDDELPAWFIQDENKHNFKSMPITREEFQREKNRLLAINARAPKKVLEAKCRKKMKLMRKLRKTKQRAEKIMEQEGVAEYHKMKEVNKIYQKEFREHKKDKKYVVSKNGRASGGKDSRNVKHVDSRLKKDKRSISKRIKKTRHVHRKDKRKARF